MLKKRKEGSLLKVLSKTVAVLLVVAVCGFGLFKLVNWFRTGRAASGGSAPAAAVAVPMDNLAKARELYTTGKLEEARVALEPLAKPGKGAEGLEAMILLARLRSAEGKADEAFTLLEQAYKDGRTSPVFADTAVAYAKGLEARERFDEAAKIFEEVRASSPPELQGAALTGLGRKAERANDLIAARQLYRQAVLDAPWNSEVWEEAADALGRADVALIFSPAPTPESKQYAIQKGDSITSIGNSLNTTQGLLTRANGIDEKTRLSLGQQIKYTPKDFRIVIERATCRLFLLDKDGLFKRYHCGLGKPGHETALGAYKIGNKEKDPIWHKPGAGAIPALDPKNELGTRWMPLVPDQSGLPRDLGIHGTIHPETVGTFCSNGCARLVKEDIEELYDLVVRATPVEIVDTFNLKEYMQKNQAAGGA